MSIVYRIWNEILTVFALVFLFAFSYPAFDPSISATFQSNLDLLQWVIWAAFALDLLIGLVSTNNKKHSDFFNPYISDNKQANNQPSKNDYMAYNWLFGGMR